MWPQSWPLTSPLLNTLEPGEAPPLLQPQGTLSRVRGKALVLGEDGTEVGLVPRAGGEMEKGHGKWSFPGFSFPMAQG